MESLNSRVSAGADGLHPPARLAIDRAAVARNYETIRKRLAPGCQAAAVIKADCYGLGITGLLPVFEKQDCPFYFVATLDEALAARRLTKRQVAVLGGVQAGWDADPALNILPILNAPADIQFWQEECQRRGRALPAVLHFDTGMNRLGITAHETRTLLNDPRRLENIDIQVVMSHFACADADVAMNDEQNARFASVAARFPAALKSLANSAGLFRDKAYHYDMARPGMALYGLNPTPGQPSPMAGVVRLDACILQVKDVAAGETVGYGATHRFAKEGVVATVALGYADGFLRSLSNRGRLYYQGAACPVVGRVSMDAVTVAVEGARPRPGEMMEVLGPRQGADDLADAAGTIGYEILTALGPRCARIYTD